MKIRRWSLATFVATALVIPNLAACNQGGEPDATRSEAPAIPADPKEALLASTKEISNGTFRFTITSDGMTGEGSVHKESRSAQMSMQMGDPAGEFSMAIDLVFIHPDTWVKLSIGGEMAKLPEIKKLASAKYMHLDPSKVKDLEDLQVDLDDVDPAGSDQLTKAIVDVKKTGEGAYSGTIDLSKATDADLVDEELVTALAAKANAVPFEAKLDAQGRLTELALQIPAAGETEAHELKVTYSDYDATTAVQKPAASETEEAPAEVYEMFNQ